MNCLANASMGSEMGSTRAVPCAQRRTASRHEGVMEPQKADSLDRPAMFGLGANQGTRWRLPSPSESAGYFFVARLRLFALAAVISLMVNGCSSTAPHHAGVPTEQNDHAEAKGEDEKGGAELWSARCSQCHYPRDPGYFSDAQWEVIMLHMRVRANLTAKEHHALVEFLKSAN
ncbi:MAG: hypothetical protein L0Z50_05525 [Verrucomicrobiales bacterium]|nr:hypothetical protein [Verrucomicrobiales bacterium]